MGIKDDAFACRSFKLKIKAHLKQTKQRLTLVEIANIAEELIPGEQHFTGGLLFERWLYENAKKETWKWMVLDEQSIYFQHF